MKRSSKLASLALIDIALGFGIQAIVLLTVGVGPETDAYYAGQAPTLVLLAIFQLPLQRALVAAFAERESATYPAYKLYLVVVLALGFVVAVLGALAPFVVPLAFPGLSPETTEIAVSVLRVQGCAIVLMIGNLVWLSLNHVKGAFLKCELALAISSFISAVWVVATVDRFGVMSAAYAQVLKATLSGVAYYFFLRGAASWHTPPWQQIWSVVKPLSMAGSLSKLTPLVDRSIASAATSGSLTILVFAQTIYSAAVGVAERAIVAPRLPALKRDPAAGVSFRVSFQLAVAGAMLVVALSLGTGVILQVPAVVSAFSAQTLKLLLESFILLAGLPIGTLAAQWMAATMVFVGQSRLSARIMTWCFLLGIPVKILGFELGGIRGLAVAMSCYYLASAVSLWLVLRRIGRQRREPT